MSANLILSIQGDFLQQEFWGEKLSNLFWCFGIILGTLLLKRPLANILTRISSNLTERFNNIKLQRAIDTGIRRPMERLLQVVLYYLAIMQLETLLARIAITHIPGRKVGLNISLDNVLDHVCIFLFIIFFTQLVSGLIDFIYQLRLAKAREEQDTSRAQLLPLLKEMGKLLLWILSIFWLLGSVFHVNIPALIAGLGIGGIAIALAGKETVENLFAAFTILSDKPFHVGEVIKLGEIEGTVERIGFRSTRLRSSEGSVYIIPNQKLVSENLINLSWRNTRGMKLVMHIKYGIAADKIGQMIEDIRSMLKTTEPIVSPIEIVMETYGEKTFQLVISYHVPGIQKEGETVNDIKQRISFATYGIVTSYVGDNHVSNLS